MFRGFAEISCACQVVNAVRRTHSETECRTRAQPANKDWTTYVKRVMKKVAEEAAERKVPETTVEAKSI